VRWRSRSVDGQGVHGVHRVARGHQGSDQQAAVDLDADGDFGRLLGVCCHHLVKLGHPFDPVRHPPFGEHLPVHVHHAHVVVGLRPVDSDEDHAPSFSSTTSSLEEYAAP
jgi:hypothetical protein